MRPAPRRSVGRPIGRLVVKEPNVGVNHGDGMVVAGVDDALVVGRARRRRDVFNTHLQMQRKK